MMCDFDSFDKDFDKDIFSDTFDLLEDIKSAGYDLRKSKFFNMPMDKIFDSPFFTRDRALRKGDAFSSFPRFSSGASRKSASTTESSETDSGDEVFNSRSFRRSDSTYSTSSHDTTSSGETVSEAPASRNFPRRTNIRRQIPVQHIVTAQPNKAKLSKKLENEFLKDERHSMPHEIYSQCDSGVGSERPKSVPPKPDMLSSGWRDDGSNFQCFPSRVMESKDMESIPELQSDSNVNSSQCYTKSNVVSKSPEREVHKSKCLPDILKTDQTKVHPRAPKVGCGKNDDSSWNERQQRIEGALKWLRSELGLLRAQDKVLLSQLKRCQDTIEVIKKQRSEEMEELGEEDEGHWEDWEIAEFDRRCREGEIIDDLSPTYTGNKVQEIPTNVEVKS